jgi:hypothetical protein
MSVRDNEICCHDLTTEYMPYAQFSAFFGKFMADMRNDAIVVMAALQNNATEELRVIARNRLQWLMAIGKNFEKYLYCHAQYPTIRDRIKADSDRSDHSEQRLGCCGEPVRREYFTYQLQELAEMFRDIEQQSRVSADSTAFSVETPAELSVRKDLHSSSMENLFYHLIRHLGMHAKNATVIFSMNDGGLVINAHGNRTAEAASDFSLTEKVIVASLEEFRPGSEVGIAIAEQVLVYLPSRLQHHCIADGRGSIHRDSAHTTIQQLRCNRRGIRMIISGNVDFIDAHHHFFEF